ncbi:MAG: tetratricopeptide repeat protein [Vicinamibacterales bacterium]
MKRKERQHLKENELAHTLTAARAFIEPRTRQIGGLAVVAFLIVIAIAGVLIIRGRTDDRGAELLADAMVALNARVVPATATSTAPGELPAAATLGATGSFATEEAKLNVALPKLKAAADAFPDSEAGITARYHYAATLAALGKPQDAVQAFDDVMTRAGAESLYGRMAAMGRADTQAKAGQLDAAIASWKALAGKADTNLPTDAILLELGRAYQAKGNRDEARKTFNQLVEEFPSSPYTPEARAELAGS